MDPTEHVQEHLQHTAAHGDHHDEHGGGGHGHSSRWITAAALTAAILAAFAAISGALSNGHLTESTHKRIDANDQWSYYQSKSIKSSNLDTRIYMAQLFKVPPAKKDLAKKADYERDLPEIQTYADALVKISDQHVEIHETYETAETLFHISIAIVAIAVVAKRRSFWYVSMVVGLCGLIFFSKAYSHHINPEPEAPAGASVSATSAEKPAHASAEHAAPAGEKVPAAENPANAESSESPARPTHEKPPSENLAPATTAP